MMPFYFCHRVPAEVPARIRQLCQTRWTAMSELHCDDFWLFAKKAPSLSNSAETKDVIGAVSGYVRHGDALSSSVAIANGDQLQLERFLREIIRPESWPLNEDWTGSFSAVGYSIADGSVVLCNDVLGYLPVYYSQCNDGVIGGTNLVLIGQVLKCGPDAVGVLQKTRTPNCNYGRRTPLRGVQRLLPGEWLRLSRQGRHSRFDNSLCNGVLDRRASELAPAIWETLRGEVDLAIGSANKVYVALSGGWDSRLVLNAAAGRSRDLQCVTYGDGDFYETTLARRCAEVVGATHQHFSIENRFFPSRKEFEQLVGETEAANMLVWNTIVDAFQESHSPSTVILLGDHCESVDGRNMASLGSRSGRVRSFLNGLWGAEDVIPSSTPQTFREWKIKKTDEILSGFRGSYERLAEPLAAECPLAVALEETRQDLEQCFRRIEDVNPPFAPMYDELFAWFHRTRFGIASQNLLLSAVFQAMSPMMSMRALRLISTVHPKVRMRRRLMDALARLPEFDRLSRVPSAQIPWVGARAPAILREVIWGFRSGTDQILTRRMMRTRNPGRRRRILKSFDWTAEYRRPNSMAAVQAWFSGRWIKADKYAEKVTRRAALDDWPMMNDDIASSANVSVILDLSQGA